MGSVGNKQSQNKNSYLEGYLNNATWITKDEERKMMTDYFYTMPENEQYYYSLPDNEKSALIAMQVSTKSVNEDLRNGTISEQGKEFVNLVKSAINKYNLTKPVTLYRGVSEAEFNSIVSNGKTDSFKSTSTDLARAQAFNQNQGGYLIEYRAGKGANVADVNGAPGANENEYLINVGVKYKKVEKVSDKKVIIYI